MAALSIVMRFSLHPQIFFSVFSLPSRNPPFFSHLKNSPRLTFVQENPLEKFTSTKKPSLWFASKQAFLYQKYSAPSGSLNFSKGLQEGRSLGACSLRAYLFS